MYLYLVPVFYQAVLCTVGIRIVSMNTTACTRSIKKNHLFGFLTKKFTYQAISTLTRFLHIQLSFLKTQVK